MMEVDALGEGVANPQKVDQFGCGVASKHAVLFKIHDETAVLEDEGMQDALVVELGEAAKVGVALKIVEKIRADCSADDIGPKRRTSLDGVNNLLLKMLAF